MPKVFIALLRGINVSGRNKIPMNDLRSLCADLGWISVESYIQSGNLIFRADADARTLEADLERAIDQRFGLSIPVIVRSAQRWADYVAGNPFPNESEEEPASVALALSKDPPKPNAVDALQERADAGERLVQIDDALWIHFPGGVGKSKLTPAVLDRFVGSPVTARNWRTVIEIDKRARSLMSTQ